MKLDVYNFYNKMQRNNIMLSFKGDITPDLLSSILQIMETKLDNIQESPKVKKKIYNVLVECLQNLYHHMDEHAPIHNNRARSAVFLVGKQLDEYFIVTGNYIKQENVLGLKNRLTEINKLDKEQLKDYYKQILNNGQMSEKGGGGLGMIDIARKTGQKLDFIFLPVDDEYSFFTLNIKISQEIPQQN